MSTKVPVSLTRVQTKTTSPNSSLASRAVIKPPLVNSITSNDPLVNEKPAKEVKRSLVNRKPEKKVKPPLNISRGMRRYLRHRLNRATHLLHRYDDGSYLFLPNALYGNKSYAYRSEKMIKTALKYFWLDDMTSLWITLTCPYSYTYEGQKASWEACRKQLPVFIRRLRAKGLDAHIAVKEANSGGGCHLHALLRWRDKLDYVPYEYIDDRDKQKKVKYILTGGEGERVRDLIKAAWEIGYADVQVTNDEEVGKYLVKELGKQGHIEDALRRSERDWGNEGDDKFKESDIKKLYACYWSTKLGIRRITKSRNLPSVEPEADADAPDDLISTMTNPTSKPKRIGLMAIPYWVKKEAWYSPYTRKLTPDDIMFVKLKELFPLFFDSG